MHNLRNIRKAAGMTQKELGDQCGVSNFYISNIENQKHAPSILTAARIAHALGCTLDDLVEDPNDKAA